MRYFWFHRPDEEHPPAPVRNPEDVGHSERLAISCTQTDLPASRQRALVREWCEVLPRLEHVRLLWFTTRVPQALFDAACQAPNLAGLYVKWSGIKALDALADARDLRYLHLGSSSAVESLNPLSGCVHLRALGIQNFRRIRDLTPLSSLSGLEELAVEGSTWSTQHVDTLEPIGSLRGLRYLSLVNLRAGDGTLRPLFALRRLEGLHIAQWWDAEEVRELYRLNPGLAA